jgi:hypothetical protein
MAWQQLAEAGINTLTVDSRGHVESGGKYDNWTDPNRDEGMQKAQADIDVAFQFLASRPGVDSTVIGVGGARILGVDNSVQTARRHTAEVKSLVLISGETFRLGVEFLHQASQLPEPFVVSASDGRLLKASFFAAANRVREFCLQINHTRSRGVLRQRENSYHKWQRRTESHFVHSILLKVQTITYTILRKETRGCPRLSLINGAYRVA